MESELAWNDCHEVALHIRKITTTTLIPISNPSFFTTLFRQTLDFFQKRIRERYTARLLPCTVYLRVTQGCLLITCRLHPGCLAQWRSHAHETRTRAFHAEMHACSSPQTIFPYILHIVIFIIGHVESDDSLPVHFALHLHHVS